MKTAKFAEVAESVLLSALSGDFAVLVIRNTF